MGYQPEKIGAFIYLREKITGISLPSVKNLIERRSMLREIKPPQGD